MRSGDESPEWEVLPSRALGDQVARYRPPASDRPDPITLVGKRDQPGRRFRGFVWGFFVTLTVLLGVLAKLADTLIPYALVGSVIAFLVVLTIVAIRRPLWKRPKITVNGENLTATDVAGVTRTWAWSDLQRIDLVWTEISLTDELHLIMTSALGGQDVTVNLGEALNMDEVGDALTSRAPEGMNILIGPRRAIDEI
jgi:hypothetical protein